MALTITMTKSAERINLESSIKAAHKRALSTATNMLGNEYDGNLKKALEDQDFISRMHNAVAVEWVGYVNGYRELEALEAKEGYPAMNEAVRVLDNIASFLPESVKGECYYPFSGVDFYWLRIFDKVVFQDIGFYQEEEVPNMWWDVDTYSDARINDIVRTLKSQDIIDESQKPFRVTGDAEKPEIIPEYNCATNTLLMKGGHDVLDFLENRYPSIPLNFGAIVIGTPANPFMEVAERLSYDGYNWAGSSKGTDYLIPYSMELEDLNVFVKE